MLDHQYQERRKRLWGATPEPMIDPSIIAFRKAENDAAKSFSPMVIQMKNGDVTPYAVDETDDTPIKLKPRGYWRTIIREVSEKYSISEIDICGVHRRKDIVAARFEVYYRMRMETTLSFTEIAYRVGGRDHTSVMHGVQTHIRRLNEGMTVEDSKKAIRVRKNQMDTINADKARELYASGMSKKQIGESLRLGVVTLNRILSEEAK